MGVPELAVPGGLPRAWGTQNQTGMGWEGIPGPSSSHPCHGQEQLPPKALASLALLFLGSSAGLSWRNPSLCLGLTWSTETSKSGDGCRAMSQREMQNHGQHLLPRLRILPGLTSLWSCFSERGTQQVSALLEGSSQQEQRELLLNSCSETFPCQVLP